MRQVNLGCSDIFFYHKTHERTRKKFMKVTLFDVMKANCDAFCRRDTGAPYSLRRRQQGGKLPHRVKGTNMKFCTAISYLNATTLKNFRVFLCFFVVKKNSSVIRFFQQQASIPLRKESTTFSFPSAFKRVKANSRDAPGPQAVIMRSQICTLAPV